MEEAQNAVPPRERAIYLPLSLYPMQRTVILGLPFAIALMRGDQSDLLLGQFRIQRIALVRFVANQLFRVLKVMVFQYCTSKARALSSFHTACVRSHFAFRRIQTSVRLVLLITERVLLVFCL